MPKWERFTGGRREDEHLIDDHIVKMFAPIFRSYVGDGLGMTDREIFMAMSELARAGFVDFRFKMTPKSVKVRSKLISPVTRRPCSPELRREFMFGPELH